MSQTQCWCTSQPSAVVRIWRGDDRTQRHSTLGALNLCSRGCSRNTEEMRISGIYVLCHTAVHYGKQKRKKAQPCLESAVDFCAQAMQELSYWFGLSSWQDPYLSTAKFVQENPGSMDWHFSLLANLQLRNFHCCTSHPHPDPKY